MNLLATALVMGILFLPSAPVAQSVETSTTETPAPAAKDDPSPRKVAVANAASTNPTSQYNVQLTAYNAVVGQTDSDPMTTASGLRSNPEVIAARSADLKEAMPFGTVIQITRAGKDTPGCKFSQVESYIGYRVIGDSMHYRWTKRVDVELDITDTVVVDGRTVSTGIALGVCSNVTVKVVGYIPLSQVPGTQAELAHMFAPRELAINK